MMNIKNKGNLLSETYLIAFVERNDYMEYDEFLHIHLNMRGLSVTCVPIRQNVQNLVNKVYNNLYE